MNDLQQKYREKNILSMSQSEQLLFVFDEGIKQLRRAEIALEDDNEEMFFDAMDRSVRVVSYLRKLLNMAYPVSYDLRRIYDYLIYDLSRTKAAGARMKDEIGRIIHILSELREAFEGAAKTAGADHFAEKRSVVG